MELLHPTKKINRYVCDVCGQGVTTVVQAVKGRTPDSLACIADDKCNGAMQSQHYDVAQSAVPQWGWYSPTVPVRDRLAPHVRYYVQGGGLILRAIKPPKVDRSRPLAFGTPGHDGRVYRGSVGGTIRVDHKPESKKAKRRRIASNLAAARRQPRASSRDP